MRKKNVTLRNKEIQYLPILNQVALSDIHTMFLFPLTQGSNFSVLFPSLLLMLLSFTHSGVLVLISPIPQILTLPCGHGLQEGVFQEGGRCTAAAGRPGQGLLLKKTQGKGETQIS